MLKSSAATENPLMTYIRKDIPGRFNEVDIVKRQWPRIVACMQCDTIPPYEVIIHPSSTCNLCCVWCIGDQVPIETSNNRLNVLDASKTSSQRLADSLRNPENMLRVIKSILDYKKIGIYTENGQEHTKEFKVENVSFSGLIGEPLVSRNAVIAAMRLLISNGLRVGIYTNGVLMDESALDTIVESAYINLSLDAGNGESYRLLRSGGKKNGEKLFNQALQNLKRLVKKRGNKPGSTLEINASFVLYPGNYAEVFDAASILKDIGVDILRLKQDISRQRLLNAEQRKKAQALLNKIRVELVDEQFKLVEIHKLYDTDEMKRSCSTCLITELMAAIGSDGNLYPCNYHPRPGGATYGNAINTPFGEIWEGEIRKEIKKRLPHICPAVCDPFKNRSNGLLCTIKDIYQSEGLDRLEVYKEELVESVP